MRNVHSVLECVRPIGEHHSAVCGSERGAPHGLHDHTHRMVPVDQPILHNCHESNSGMDMATRKCQKIEPYKDGYWIVFGWLGVHGVVGGFYRFNDRKQDECRVDGALCPYHDSG